MIKYAISLWLMLICCAFGYAQNTLKINIFTAEEKEPLFGATIYIESLDKGVTTDFDGIALLEDVPDGQYNLQISYLGFETLEANIVVPTGDDWVFYLKESANALDEVVVRSSRSTRTIQRIPTRIEYIGVEELGEKAIMNPTNISMVLRESTGIQMQQTSLSSANTNIRIQGLDGRYTQLLRDGFPLYGGFSSGLSILQIPPLDLRQFEIIKGSSSTLYGGGAIAGLVNMVSKTPNEEPELDIMLTQTQALGSTANIFYSERNEKWGWTLYGSGHLQKAFDPEDDGFSNLPRTRSLSFNPKLFYYPSEKTTVWFGINGTYDDRQGGDITKIEEGENGIHQYTEENLSKRISTQAVFETHLDSTQSISVKNSIAFFDRSLEIPDLSFKGTQWNTFSEASYQKQGLTSDWVLGANLYTTSFDEMENPVERDQRDITYGLFANSIYDLSDRWILETGVRTDYAEDWGFFPLPRVSLLYKSDTSFSSRIGGGLGYKIPDIFTEEAEFINFRDVLPIDRETMKAERSYGLNLDFNYQTRLSDELGFSVNQLFYLTAIRNGLLLNSLDNGQFQFENATGEILSKGSETNIKFTFRDFRWFLNYALIDARLNYLP
ncbi:TonB-dependent receptor [Zobellia laminariae]|uniref:TonB-dependent receptor n=1 Tax=Zobellia laminariae TaxID=248906 RepID=UPI0026F4501F|nr:TonB-dependent receptor [Zobellia laminariae]WKX76928.1 TonB-dependent receptor [Zobellia laminariae]